VDREQYSRYLNSAKELLPEGISDKIQLQVAVGLSIPEKKGIPEYLISDWGRMSSGLEALKGL
jgi:hypothetical protein